MANILVVDDEVGIRELLSEILRDEGHDVLLAENAGAARAARNGGRPDLVLLDIWMPDTDGISLLKEWSAGGQLNMPVVMMSGHGTIDTAVEATRIGALDYLEKPIALQKLLAAVKRGLQRQPGAVATHLSLNAFPRSAVLKEFRRRLEQMAARARCLLLRSQAGGIAELAARTLQGPGKPWLDLGHQGTPLATEQLEGARGGVLYVAELAALSKSQQKNLAFALERLERYDQRLLAGSTVAAEQLRLQHGWEDAPLKRLFEVSLMAPSLAELRDDVPDLASQVLSHLVEGGGVPLRRFSTAALNALRLHPWSGGLDDLAASVKSLALAALEEEIGVDDVRRHVGPAPSPAGALSLDLPLREAREAFERIYFEHHLRLDGTNMTRLAEKTGLERTHLYRKLKQLGIPTGRRGEAGAEAGAEAGDEV